MTLNANNLGFCLTLGGILVIMVVSLIVRSIENREKRLALIERIKSEAWHRPSPDPSPTTFVARTMEAGLREREEELRHLLDQERIFDATYLILSLDNLRDHGRISPNTYFHLLGSVNRINSAHNLLKEGSLVHTPTETPASSPSLRFEREDVV